MTAFPGWTEILTQITAGEDLDRATAEAALSVVLAGEADPVELAGWLVGLRTKGESVDEVVGMVDAMLAAAERLDLPEGTIDIVGTGGSSARRENAVNVSTMASIVAASAGATVCKHGNRRASSSSGSTDVLDALGISVELGPAAVERCVRDVGVGFAFARMFHPAMRHAAPVRATLGIPTVFNVLGPLSHPAGITRQVLGVARPDLVPLVSGVLAARRSPRAWVVHGSDGLDELTLAGETLVVDIVDGHPTEHLVDPAELGLSVVEPGSVPGGGPDQNAAIAESVFAGTRGLHRELIALNAGAGLVVAGLAADLAEGVEQAFVAIDEGRAAATLDRLRAVTATLAQ